MPERKNHHYIPQFYLKFFSKSENRKTIGVFNLNNQVFHNGTSIKNQVSKKYFYGKDDRIETVLSKLESLLYPKLKEIIMENKVIVNPLDLKPLMFEINLLDVDCQKL